MSVFGIFQQQLKKRGISSTHTQKIITSLNFNDYYEMRKAL